MDNYEFEIPDPRKQLEGIEAQLARRNFKTFVKKAWPLIEPATPLLWNWHLDVICDELQAISDGTNEDYDLLINIPPGTAKSLFTSVLWPAWEWTRMPQLRIIGASYGMRLSMRDAMKMRNVVTSPWYERNYDVRLAADQAAKLWYVNDCDGWRLATSTGGEGTGEHPDRLIIDDPHKADEARSDVTRQAVLDWYDRTLSTRGVSRGVRKVIVMQRLHEEDLSNHVLSKGGKWRHLMFPMRYDPKRAHPRDPRRIPGELLWPQLFTEEKVRALEIGLGPYGTAGQLQQIPAPEGGGLFKGVWFRYVDTVPSNLRVVRGWDTASTEGAGDYTAGVKISYDQENGKFFVEDVKRGQWGPNRADEEMLSTARADGRTCSQREQKEPGSAGAMVIAKRARDLVGYDYGPSPTTGDKVTRAKPYRAQCEAGNVYLKRAPWNAEFIAEHEIFPNGKNDDQVDAASTAFNEVVTGPRPVRTVGVRWG
jgi:predicted phage terminase large subunit-like protein